MWCSRSCFGWLANFCQCPVLRLILSYGELVGVERKIVFESLPFGLHCSFLLGNEKVGQSFEYLLSSKVGE